MPHRAYPIELSRKDWWCVLQQVGKRADQTYLQLVAAGVAFFGLLALIPGFAALLALYGLIGDPNVVWQQIAALRGVAPDPVIDLIGEQAARLLSADSGALALGGLVTLVLSLWSALQGVRWFLLALTIVNRRAEKLKWFRRYVTAAGFTLSAIAVVMVAVLALGVAPLMLNFFYVGDHVETIILIARWPILGGAVIAGAFALYRWGPRRRPPPWRWLWPGAIGAPIVWIAMSSLFTFALRLFPAFGATYGSLASVVALLLWLYVSALIFLLGGALNAELEFFAEPESKPKKKPEAISGEDQVTAASEDIAGADAS